MEEERQRGATRSGARFSARNNPHYRSYKELMSHHKKLLDPEPALTERLTRIFGISDGYLSQSTLRFRFDSPVIRSTLRSVFNRLFAKHPATPTDGFEVVTTFNCVLHNQDSSTFSIFYGQDHRAQNDFGAAPELKYGTTVIVRSVLDLHKIETNFNEEELFRLIRPGFESSNVTVYKVTNVVYLIYRYISTHSSKRGQAHHRKRVLPRISELDAVQAAGAVRADEEEEEENGGVGGARGNSSTGGGRKRKN